VAASHTTGASVSRESGRRRDSADSGGQGEGQAAASRNALAVAVGFESGDVALLGEAGERIAGGVTMSAPVVAVQVAEAATGMNRGSTGVSVAHSRPWARVCALSADGTLMVWSLEQQSHGGVGEGQGSGQLVADCECSLGPALSRCGSAAVEAAAGASHAGARWPLGYRVTAL